MKTIAFYLPQFHAIPENDEWWGKGFTEWVNVKKAVPLFDGHYQPRIPYEKNYYCLLDDDKTMKWQIETAKKYGVYGFCFYHYWFDGHMLLQKPVERYLENRELDLPFCICWANEHWTNAWVSKKDNILIAQRYGGPKEWKEHFDYLLPYLKDSRYIKNDGKPLLVIYRPDLIDCLNDMLDCWTMLAKENGLPGLDFAYQQIIFDMQKDKDDSRFTYNIEYQPSYAVYDMTRDNHKFLRAVKRILVRWFDKIGVNLEQVRPEGLIKRDYDEVWRSVLNRTPVNDKCVPGAFVDWDNTPRRHDKGSVFVGASPEKFQKYMTEQIRRAKEVYHKDMLFLFAWNEWAEGGYMEPDEKYEYGYLEALRNALIANGEFPD
ncbi:MAG: glycoside hydrolase family 99-like domain-containing protein [Oscillospiraceae bacterium]|nr:glycoside hydrolase family 99-like domain-containing protein [Oscillospiraceae bacterium]MDY3065115.1 glycoside hydrolase family 99-like domain-containing protein [Oscillospiraceae bacterium]